MLTPTHLIVGQFAYLTAALATGHAPTAPEATAAAFAALLPDLDKREGIVGRLVPWLSGPLEHWVGHRTATHSLIALSLLAALAWPLPYGWWLALIAGFASHPIADMMTPAGVAWFWPARVRCVIPGNAQYRIAAMSWGELAFAVLIVALSLPVAWAAQSASGPLGLIRDWVADIGAAREHYDAHKSGYAWWLDIEGQDNRAFKPVSGRYYVIAPYKANGFLLDTDHGAVTACKSSECDWYAEHVVLKRGEPEVISTITLTAKRTTKEALIKALQEAEEAGRVYVSGMLNARGVKPMPSTVGVAGDNIALSLADVIGIDTVLPRSLRNVSLQVQLRHPPRSRTPVIELTETKAGLPTSLMKQLPN